MTDVFCLNATDGVQNWEVNGIKFTLEKRGQRKLEINFGAEIVLLVSVDDEEGDIYGVKATYQGHNHWDLQPQSNDFHIGSVEEEGTVTEILIRCPAEEQ